MNEDQKIEFVKQMFLFTGVLYCAKNEEVPLQTTTTYEEVQTYVEKFEEITNELGDECVYVALLEAFETSRQKLALLHSI